MFGFEMSFDTLIGKIKSRVIGFELLFIKRNDVPKTGDFETTNPGDNQRAEYLALEGLPVTARSVHRHVRRLVLSSVTHFSARPDEKY